MIISEKEYFYEKSRMRIEENIHLKPYNTFGLDYIADRMIHLNTEKEATALFSGYASIKKLLLVLGSGSNILFTSDFKGTIIHPEFEGIRVEKKEGDKIIISAGAGINWDKLVEWTVENGFYGLENLSLIPGSVGASPVQNIGAYGMEVRNSIEKVETISIYDGSTRTFSNVECKFGYRNSIFKGSMKGRYVVTRVYYRLGINANLNLEYGSLKEELCKLGTHSLSNVRQAVINIRRNKLPDPDLIGNAGSFFKNPVVTEDVAAALKKEYPDIPIYRDQEKQSKLAAGWLIEKCGWKGKRMGEAGVHDKQALVLINYGNADGGEIYKLSEAIRASVLNRFGIYLECEVEVVRSI